MNQWMERAVELALQNIAQGGQPFGAVLVKGEEIIGEGVNELHLRPDSTGHAELLALRRAQEKLGSIDLRGTVYVCKWRTLSDVLRCDGNGGCRQGLLC